MVIIKTEVLTISMIFLLAFSNSGYALNVT